MVVLRLTELYVAFLQMKKLVGESTFLNINTGFGYPGFDSIGAPSIYTAIASILVCGARWYLFVKEKYSLFLNTGGNVQELVSTFSEDVNYICVCNI